MAEDLAEAKLMEGVRWQRIWLLGWAPSLEVRRLCTSSPTSFLSSGANGDGCCRGFRCALLMAACVGGPSRRSSPCADCSVWTLDDAEGSSEWMTVAFERPAVLFCCFYWAQVLMVMVATEVMVAAEVLVIWLLGGKDNLLYLVFKSSIWESLMFIQLFWSWFDVFRKNLR